MLLHSVVQSYLMVGYSPMSHLYVVLFFQVLQKPTPDKKQGLVAASRKVADCLGALVKSAEALKG